MFFTFGVSLRKWKKTGLLSREMQLYKYYSSNNIHIKIFTYGGLQDMECYCETDNIEIIPLLIDEKKTASRLSVFFYSIVEAYRHKNKIYECDVLKSNQMLGAWIPMFLHWTHKKPFVLRCGYEHYKTGVLEKKPLAWKVMIYLISLLAYKSANKVILTSEEDKEFVKKTFKIKEKKIAVIPNYVDTDKFKPYTDIKQVNATRILYFGRLSREKNISAAIEACKLKEVGLDIIGDGELIENLKKQTKEINADVRFLGKRNNDDLPLILGEYNIVILPSFYEGCPKSLLEAMSCGKLVIGSDVSGIREIVQHKKTGYLTNTDYMSIAKSIEYVINNQQLIKQIGRAARKYILEKYSIERYSQDELKIYSEIINE